MSLSSKARDVVELYDASPRLSSRLELARELGDDVEASSVRGLRESGSERHLDGILSEICRTLFQSDSISGD